MILLGFQTRSVHNDASSQTFKSIEELISIKNFCVSFLLTETRETEKAKECVTIWLVAFFKLSFLDNF